MVSVSAGRSAPFVFIIHLYSTLLLVPIYMLMAFRFVCARLGGAPRGTSDNNMEVNPCNICFVCPSFSAAHPQRHSALFILLSASFEFFFVSLKTFHKFPQFFLFFPLFSCHFAIFYFSPFFFPRFLLLAGWSHVPSSGIIAG